MLGSCEEGNAASSRVADAWSYLNVGHLCVELVEEFERRAEHFREGLLRDDRLLLEKVMGPNNVDALVLWILTSATRSTAYLRSTRSCLSIAGAGTLDSMPQEKPKNIRIARTDRARRTVPTSCIQEDQFYVKRERPPYGTCVSC